MNNVVDIQKARQIRRNTHPAGNLAYHPSDTNEMGELTIDQTKKDVVFLPWQVKFFKGMMVFLLIVSTFILTLNYH